MYIEPLKFVLERVFDLLKHEVTILRVDEKKEIEDLQRELQLIESFLQDMDEVQRQATLSHVLETKVQHLMEILPEIEDFLDSSIDKKVHQARKKSICKKVEEFFTITSNPGVRKHRLVNKVAEIKEELSKTLKRPEQYQMANNSPQVAYRRRRRRPSSNSSIMVDEIIVGLEDDVGTLVAEFVGKNGMRGANSVIAGMGGSGKTTLAKMFYNHKDIKKAFPKRAWVCVSEECNTHHLLLKICALLGVVLLEHEKSIAAAKLRDFLVEGGNHCLVVLDDVWEKNDLQELLPTLLSGNGRVLITTRKEKIVKFPTISAFYLHRARHLTLEQSWELFTRIVSNCCEGKFSLDDDKDGGGYVELGKKMLAKCDGLPLAIVVLAGLLGTTHTIQQWEKIGEHVIPNMMRDVDNSSLGNETLKKVLELSYSDLPYHLKPCFLYLGLFKEDEEIDADSLINLWIEEGFVKAGQLGRQGMGLEEEAKTLLEELVQRYMLQATYRNYEGDVIRIRIHDVIRDLCINKANELGFFQVLSPSTTTSTHTMPSNYYRAIVYERESFVSDNPRLRTLIYKRGIFSSKKLHQLRVLCLHGVVLGDSAKDIGTMVLLRCLKLVECRYNIENVYFIKRLRNLETLIMSNKLRNKDSSFISKLPDNMVGNMEQLRVFELYSADITQTEEFGKKGGLSRAISGVAKRNLQRLTLDPVCLGLVEELKATNPNLLVLKLHNIRSQEHMDAICVFVGNKNFPRLEILHLQIQKGCDLGFDLQKMKWGSCEALKELMLCGKIMITKQKESWVCPPKLLSLWLEETEIHEEGDMGRFIAVLDHLMALELSFKAYMGTKLTMVGFPQLQMLKLYDLDHLRVWKIAQGSLTKLRELFIVQCWGLESIPDEISKIHTLQLLNVIGMPTFCKRLVKREDTGASQGGEDFHLVQHIPTVTFD